MSTTYTPTPVENTSYTKAQGGDDAFVASVNIWLEALSDMAAYLADKTHAIPAISWHKAVTTTQVVRRSCFNSSESKWYAVYDGATDKLQQSVDYGNTWTANAGPASGHAIFDLDADNSGNMVLVTTSVNLYDYNGSTFTSRTPGFTGTPSGGTIVYSPGGTAKWCYTYRNSTSGIRAYTSTDRSAFTDRTSNLPATFTGYTGTENPEMGVNKGNADVLMFLNTGTGTDYKGAHSNDGGVNWTAFTLGTTLNAKVSRPIYSSTDGVWLVSAFDTGGTKKFEIWSSSTGFGGWTRVKDGGATGIAITEIANIGNLWAGLGHDGMIYYSLDKGVTWRKAQVKPAVGAEMRLRGASAGFLVIDTTNTLAVPSVRAGTPGATI